MGELQLFNINQIKNRYNLNVFVETGTGDGTSFLHVLNVTKNNKFDKNYTIEIYKPLYEQCLDKFSSYTDYDLRLINNNSYDGLVQVFSEITENDNILFWLDAHFPEADFGGPKSYSSVSDKKLRIPLEEEIKLIKEYRKNSKDVLIIDDLRIYQDDNYEAGNWKDRELYGGDGIEFIYDAFADTHIITKMLNHQGYLVLIPK
jgi:hypothetical protein